MVHNTHSSPMTPHKKLNDCNAESSTESDPASSEEWMGPENQLGLEPGYLFSLEWDDQWNMEIALDKKDKNEYQ